MGSKASNVCRYIFARPRQANNEERHKIHSSLLLLDFRILSSIQLKLISPADADRRRLGGLPYKSSSAAPL